MKRPMLGHRKLKVPPLQLPGTTVNLRLPVKTQRTEHLFQIRPLYALQEGILAGSKQPHFTGGHGRANRGKAKAKALSKVTGTEPKYERSP